MFKAFAGSFDMNMFGFGVKNRAKQTHDTSEVQHVPIYPTKLYQEEAAAACVGLLPIAQHVGWQGHNASHLIAAFNT